ncbi:uncharacterized protein LOC118183374 isoform X2 [Stegodyphus dumicola]|uniref:uncharacterized protein LOC118183374 isoform X2 n=1 Tax=Stegodyphus dumicola TaxID=202533 RepID=UPI0015A9156C|nr:uncharacterized protein LOC118183374 isoform X2 [Stegodyphus dumicola]
MFFKQDKLNYGLPLVSHEGVGVSTNGNNTQYHQGSLKRPRTEDYPEIGVYQSNKLSSYICTDSRGYSKSKTFLSVRHNNYVYHTEDWKPKGCTMYLPLREDIMINVQNIEQISFESDQFFLADEKGNYVGAKSGHAVHLWRFDSTLRKLYISRSILFLKDQDFQEVQVQLDNL